VCERRKQGRVPCRQSLDRERQAQVCFPRAWRAQKYILESFKFSFTLTWPFNTRKHTILRHTFSFNDVPLRAGTQVYHAVKAKTSVQAPPCSQPPPARP
jgi:hypothetical protein